MENEIKVGEYVRTKYGEIGIVTEIYPRLKWRKKKASSDLDFNSIVKHSPNLIDLIQCGDYVNGHKVIDASDTNKGCMREVYCEDDEDFGIWDEMIETVVTKEMMESISYKVERNN